MKQQNFFQYYKVPGQRTRTTHGGSSPKNKRKNERPLSTQKWIHLTLKSSKAKGELSFWHSRNKALVERIIHEKAKKFHINVSELVNMGNHLHIKIKIPSREQFQKFLKSITNLIARKITGAKRGKKFGQFWQGLAFTRVIQTSFEELQLRGYFKANRIEASSNYRQRIDYLKQFNQWIYKLRRKSRLIEARPDS